MRVGHGFDAHRLAEGRPFVLGGVRIEHPTGPLGHSDGDALCHALCDALLGASALGDLGGHFPDTDPQWKGADSLSLLEAVHQMVARHGWDVENLDATIVVEKPKIAPHVLAMREAISDRLGLTLERISIKAKTSEGMGYTGDGSGIACHAVALIRRHEGHAAARAPA